MFDMVLKMCLLNIFQLGQRKEAEFQLASVKSNIFVLYFHDSSTLYGENAARERLHLDYKLNLSLYSLLSFVLISRKAEKKQMTLFYFSYSK